MYPEMHQLSVATTHFSELTQAVEAFFYVSTGGRHALRAREINDKFVDEYSLNPDQMPLLCLDPTNFRTPFSIRTI